MLTEQKKISRRKYLKYAGAAVGVAVVAAAGYGIYQTTQPPPTPPTTSTTTFQTTQPPAKPPIVVDLTLWAYDVPLVRNSADVIQRVYKRDKGVDLQVNIADIPYDAYKASIVSRMQANTKTDVLYVEDNWMSIWDKAGWIVPIEDYKPEISDYIPDLVPAVREAMTLHGKLYGLPYYCDNIIFMYNKAHYDQTGIDEAPKTWDELTQHAVKLKQKGISDRPLGFAWKRGEWTFEDVLFSIVYSRGKKPIDEQGNLLVDAGSGLRDTFQWIADAALKYKVLDPKSVEMILENVQDTCKAGQYSYSIAPSYIIAAINDAKTSKVAGQMKIAMMPEKGATVGFMRMDSMSMMAVKAGKDQIDGAYALIEMLGGKVDVNGTGTKEYYTAKQWAIKDGLPFGIQPLFKDPEIINAWSKWVDVDALGQQASKSVFFEAKKYLWWEDWRPAFETEVQKLIAGQVSVDSALKNVQDEWNKLKAQAG